MSEVIAIRHHQNLEVVQLGQPSRVAIGQPPTVIQTPCRNCAYGATLLQGVQPPRAPPFLTPGSDHTSSGEFSVSPSGPFALHNLQIRQSLSTSAHTCAIWACHLCRSVLSHRVRVCAVLGCRRDRCSSCSGTVFVMSVCYYARSSQIPGCVFVVRSRNRHWRRLPERRCLWK